LTCYSATDSLIYSVKLAIDITLHYITLHYITLHPQDLLHCKY